MDAARTWEPPPGRQEVGVAARCPSGAGTGLAREEAPPRRWGCPRGGQSRGRSGSGGARVWAGAELPSQAAGETRDRGGREVSARVCGDAEPPGGTSRTHGVAVRGGSHAPVPPPPPQPAEGAAGGAEGLVSRPEPGSEPRRGLRVAALGRAAGSGRRSQPRSPAGGGTLGRRAGGGVSARVFTQEVFPACATCGSHLRTRQVAVTSARARWGRSALPRSRVEAARLGTPGTGTLTAERPSRVGHPVLRGHASLRGALRGQSSCGRAPHLNTGARGVLTRGPTVLAPPGRDPTFRRSPESLPTFPGVPPGAPAAV